MQLIDILNEFAQQPLLPKVGNPMGQTTSQPVAAPARAPVSTNFGQEFVSLVDKTKGLPDNNPARVALYHLYRSLLALPAESQTESIETQSSNVAALDNVTAEVMNELIRRLQMSNPTLAKEVADELHKAAQEQGPISTAPSVQKAKVSAMKTIELNTKGEIGRQDADIEAMAQEFVKRFGVKLIWARNIVGMFGSNIPREDRDAFLKACVSGHALDIPKMLKNKSGSIDDVVNTEVPKLKEVYASVKETLLDISLSTGQRGATGPFEALLAIMGGAKKPKNDEGGDLVIAGKKYEVKSTSLTPTSKVNSKGVLPNTGGATNAWLDSGPGGEVGGSFLRKIADEWMMAKLPSLMTNPNFKAVWKDADFRSKKLPNLATAIEIIDKKRPNGGIELVSYMMSKFFPSAVGAKGFDFDASIKKIMQGIRFDDPSLIANEQGTMALIAYHLGKGNDGFIFFNSSTQEYRILDGLKDILKAARNPSAFDMKFTPMTMSNAPKASPGLYFGPEPSSEIAKNYFKQYNSDPTRVALRQNAAKTENPEYLEAEDTSKTRIGRDQAAVTAPTTRQTR
jgi:hypothetical protein